MKNACLLYNLIKLTKINMSDILIELFNHVGFKNSVTEMLYVFWEGKGK